MIALDPPEVSPEQLAQQCQAGCREAFELLVEQFQPRLFNFLCHLVGNSHDAEDLAQDTFVKAYQNIHRYDPAYGFSTWLFTIAKRTAANFYRGNRHTQPLGIEEDIDREDPAAIVARKDEDLAVWEAAKTLKPNQYQALWLRYGEDFSIEETARIMGMNQIHVRVLLHRARGHLAALMRRRSASARPPMRLEKTPKPSNCIHL